MVEYVPDMHIVERSSRSVRILADWCSGSTPDSDSGDIGPIPVLAVKSIRKKEVKIMKRLSCLRGAGDMKKKVKFAPVAEQEYALDLKSKEV